MSTLMMALLLSLTGCGSSDEAETASVDAQATDVKAKGAKGGKVARKGQKGAKGKGGKAKKGGKGAKTRTAGKGGGAGAKPIGAAGPMTGELKLTEVESPSTPAGAAAATAEGTEAAAPAPATEAQLVLSYGEGESTEVKLGKVPGTCAEITPTPVGPEGKERTPLWAVKCDTSKGEELDLVIVQAGDNLAVLKSADPAETKGIGFKPVKKVRLAKGAELTRGG